MAAIAKLAATKIVTAWTAFIVTITANAWLKPIEALLAIRLA